MNHLARLESTSKTGELIYGCQVVTAGGESIGKVRDILISKTTRQLKFIGCGKTVIPWNALYFDAMLGRLVFYTMK